MLALAASAALLSACRRVSAPRPDPAGRAEATPPTAARDAPLPIPGKPVAQPTATVAGRPVTAPAKRGGKLVAARLAEPADLDPQLNPSTARRQLTMLTYSNLVKLAPDMSIRSDLAESWRVAEDGRRIDFTLRQRVMWHPPVSRELTAADVAFSYERLLQVSPGRTELAAIIAVEASGRYQVSFRLSAPAAGLLAAMADSRWGAIVSRETVERHGDLRRAAVGTGPFILDEWQPGRELRLRRNPEYFEKEKPYVESVVLRLDPDETSIAAGLRSGAFHHAALEHGAVFAASRDERSLKLYRSPRLGYDFLSINHKAPPFDDPRVVQAVSYAVDRQECINVAALGFGVLTAPCPPPLGQWQIPREHWEPFYRVDLERARRLLAESSYPRGFQATALTISSFPALFASAQVVQANLKRIGIDLRVESADYEIWLRRWRTKEFQCTFNGSAGHVDPDAALYPAFHSKAQNWNNLEHAELDRLLEQGRAVTEIEKRKSIYDRAQRILLEEPGQLWLYTPDMLDVTHASLRGFWQHPTGTLWSYQDVWLDT